jgi:hypothetical protein
LNLPQYNTETVEAIPTLKEEEIVIQEEKEVPMPQQVDSKSEPIQQTDQNVLDEDVRKVLALTDDLLGKLPDNIIEEFAASEEFKLYQKVMVKYQIKG